MQPSTAHYHPAIRTANIKWFIDVVWNIALFTLSENIYRFEFWTERPHNVLLMFLVLVSFFFQNLFQMGTRLWRRFCVHKFKFLLVVLVIALFIGEIGCFCLCFVTWRMPQASSDSLNLLFVSDSQIQVSLSCKEALDMRQKSSFTVFDLNALSY